MHDVLTPAGGRRGHFAFESGHHSDRWLELELLCLRPGELRPLAAGLARRLAAHEVDLVCGPLAEGAFVGLMVALELGVEFAYADRIGGEARDTLFPIAYRLPPALRDRVRGRRVAIVNDVVSAGSAVRGTLADLEACGADTAAIGVLLALGSAMDEFVAAKRIPLEALAREPANLWTPDVCPLCRDKVPLERPANR